MTEEQKYILLVEDNPDDAELARIGFKRNRITIPLVHVKNGKDALDYLFCRERYKNRDAKEMPLALILDLKMPVMSGTDVLKQLKEHEKTRNLTVIVLTSSKEEQDMTICQELGVSAYLQKPINFMDFDGVVRTIADILAQEAEDPVSSVSG